MVRCYGARSDESGDRQFIFLEYCAGGELFDKIEPEVGMPEHQAHCFFMQLLDAVVSTIVSGGEPCPKVCQCHSTCNVSFSLYDMRDCRGVKACWQMEAKAEDGYNIHAG